MWPSWAIVIEKSAARLHGARASGLPVCAVHLARPVRIAVPELEYHAGDLLTGIREPAVLPVDDAQPARSCRPQILRPQIPVARAERGRPFEQCLQRNQVVADRRQIGGERGSRIRHVGDHPVPPRQVRPGRCTTDPRDAPRETACDGLPRPRLRPRRDQRCCRERAGRPNRRPAAACPPISSCQAPRTVGTTAGAGTPAAHAAAWNSESSPSRSGGSNDALTANTPLEVISSSTQPCSPRPTRPVNRASSPSPNARAISAAWARTSIRQTYREPSTSTRVRTPGVVSPPHRGAGTW